MTGVKLFPSQNNDDDDDQPPTSTMSMQSMSCRLHFRLTAGSKEVIDQVVPTVIALQCKNLPCNALLSELGHAMNCFELRRIKSFREG